MEQSFIENLERRRYRLMFSHTVSFGVWFAAFMYSWMTDWANVKSWWWLSILVFALVAAGFFGVYSYKLGRITKQIVSDPKLHAAINNELYIANDYKAVAWGYYITLFAIVVMFLLTIFFDIPGKIMMGILVWVGALSAKVAQLIMHR